MERRDLQVPLLDEQGNDTACLKLFQRRPGMTKRLQRSQWLIAQNVHSWYDGLSAAPRAWLDTRNSGRTGGISFDFAGSLSLAARGRSWSEIRSSIVGTGLSFSEAIDFNGLRNCLKRWSFWSGITLFMATCPPEISCVSSVRMQISV